MIDKKTINKKELWEKKFSDNYVPTLFTSLIQRFEVNRKKVILKLLSKGEVVVDLACGDGDLLLQAVDMFDRLIGFDIAQNRIIKARKKARNYPKGKFDFREVDLDQGIPLKDNTASTVICEASLGYFYDTGFILSEVHRILKKGGIFIVQVPNYAFLPRRLTLLLGRLPKTSAFEGYGDGGSLHYFTYDSLEQLLVKYKFRVLCKENSGLLPFIRKIWPELLAADIIFKTQKI